MIDWLHDRNAVLLALIVFALTFLVAAAIYLAVMALATGERGRAFKQVSPGMLPPLGIIFGLVVGFLAVQVWSDSDRAKLAVDREASALRTAVLLSERFPGAPEARIRALVASHVHEAAAREWPAMQEQSITLAAIPTSLAETLQVALALEPEGEGQKVAQRELVAAIEAALDARRQRIILSASRLNWVKWSGVVLLAALTLLAIGLVHSDNRRTAAIAMAIFASAAAISISIIAVQDRPFSGQFAVRPDLLLQVAPIER